MRGVSLFRRAGVDHLHQPHHAVVLVFEDRDLLAYVAPLQHY